MSDIHYLRESSYQRYMRMGPCVETVANQQLLDALHDVEEQITQEEADDLLEMLRLQHEFLEDILTWRQGESLPVNWQREGF